METLVIDFGEDWEGWFAFVDGETVYVFVGAGITES